MDAEAKRRVEELFHRAVALAPEDQSTFLLRECPDESVREAVEELLRLDRLSGDPVSGLGDVVREFNAGAARQESGVPEMLRQLGDYRLVREVGRGGMGQVFEAIQESLGRRVAVKILPGAFAFDSSRLERFQREARATAAIRHPNIVPVYDVGEDGGIAFYAMEYVDGAPLSVHVDDARKAARREGVRRGKGFWTPAPGFIASQVEQMASLSEGLAEAHQQGLVHRDVKPSNILVDKSGRFVLVDFGLVHDETAETITRSGDLMGTVRYMSPEQISRGPVDARSDVYGLGVTLYELLTLRLPFDGDSLLDIQKRILQQEPTPPRRLNGRLNADLETIILHSLEKDADRRYSSAADLAADLRRFLRYEPIRARPQFALAKWARRLWRRRFAGGALMIMVALLMTVTLLLTEIARERHGQREARYESVVRDALSGIDIPWSPRGYRDAGIGTTQGWKDTLRRAPRSAIQRLERAAENLAEAAESLPERPDAHYYRGKTLFLLYRLDESLEALQAAIDRRSDLVSARVLRAVIHRRRGDLAAETEERAAARRSARSELAKAWFRVLVLVPRRPYETDVTAEYDRLLGLFARDGEPYLGAAAELRMGRANRLLIHGAIQPAISDFDIAATLTGALEPEIRKAQAYGLWARKEGQRAAARERIDAESFLHELWNRVPDERQDEVALAAIFVDGIVAKENTPDWARKLIDPLLQARNLATTLAATGQLGEAFVAGERAIEIAPGDPLAWMILGRLHQQEENRSAARECYEEAVRLHPGHGDAQYTLGKLHRRDRELARAAHALEAVLRVSPSSFVTHAELAWVYDAQGKADASFEQFCRASAYATRRGGSAVRAHSGRYLREIWARLRQVKDKVKPSTAFDLLLGVWEDELELHGQVHELHWPVMALAWLYHPGKSDRERALDFATRAVEESGRKVLEPLEALAEVLWASSERNEAIRVLEEALRLAPERDELLENLAAYRREVLPDAPSYPSLDAVLESCRGDVRKENELLEAFSEVASGADRADRILYLGGRIAQRRGDLAAAKGAFAAVVSRSAVGTDGARPEPLLRLAETLRAMGRPGEAESMLRETIARGRRGDRALWALWVDTAHGELGWPYDRLLEIFSPELTSYFHLDGSARADDSGETLVISRADEEPRGLAFFKLPLPTKDLTVDFEILMEAGSGWLGGGSGIRFVLARSYEYPGWGHGDLPAATEIRVQFNTLNRAVGGEHTIAVSSSDNRESIVTHDVPGGFRDGLWHPVRVRLQRGRIDISFDGEVAIPDFGVPGFQDFTGYFGFVVFPGAGWQKNLVRKIRVHVGSD